jgi:phosphotransferase system enzyme I (PtsI)
MLLEGTPASPGIAIGPAFLINVGELRIARQTLPDESAVEREIARFDHAIEEVREELETLSAGLDDVLEGRQIVEVHLLLLDDPTMQNEVRACIRRDLVNAEYAVSLILREVIERLRKLEDPYMRERVTDVRDVGRRVMARLLGTEREVLGKVPTPVILVSRELDPSDTAELSRDQVLAFVTDRGGKTSHTAILARSLGIPAVVALKEIAEIVEPRQTLIVDGIHGKVIVDPDESQLLFYTELRRRYEDAEAEIAQNADEEAVTADGVRIELAANIEFSQEADQVRRFGGRGVGLFRTEFLGLLYPESDDEEEQHYEAYRHVLETVHPDPAIIRTLDLGGDKFLGDLSTVEANPFLGWRAIRVCLDQPARFRNQIRAILRASALGNARLMIPMITDVFQVRRTRDYIRETCDELRSKGIPFDEKLPVGIMVETPAAALGIDLLLPWVDFVSIGTNDLTQYTLAVDRGSPYVAHLFDPLHPTVLRQIDHVCRACRASGKWVGVCGQIAGEPLAVPLLLGLGVNELSVALTDIPDVKKMISVVTVDGARSLVRQALTMESGWKIRELVRGFVMGSYPEILLEDDHGEE